MKLTIDDVRPLWSCLPAHVRRSMNDNAERARERKAPSPITPDAVISEFRGYFGTEVVNAALRAKVVTADQLLKVMSHPDVVENIVGHLFKASKRTGEMPGFPKAPQPRYAIRRAFDGVEIDADVKKTMRKPYIDAVGRQERVERRDIETRELIEHPEKFSQTSELARRVAQLIAPAVGIDLNDARMVALAAKLQVTLGEFVCHQPSARVAAPAAPEDEPTSSPRP